MSTHQPDQDTLKLLAFLSEKPSPSNRQIKLSDEEAKRLALQIKKLLKQSLN